MALARDWGQVSTADALTPALALLRGDEEIPRDLYTATDVPKKYRYGYEVSIYGRDLATGQFASRKYSIPVSREMTPDEVIEMAESSLGRRGRSPEVEIWSAKVTHAWRSVEIEW